MKINNKILSIRKTQRYYNELGKIWNKGRSYLNPKTQNYTHVYKNRVVVTKNDLNNSAESLRKMDIEYLKRKELFVSSCEWKDKTIKVTKSNSYLHHYLYIGDGKWSPVYIHTFPLKIFSYK